MWSAGPSETVAALLSAGASVNAGGSGNDNSNGGGSDNSNGGSSGALCRAGFSGGAAVTSQLLAAKNGTETVCLGYPKNYQQGTPAHLALDPLRRERVPVDDEGEVDEEMLETLEALLKKAKEAVINAKDAYGQTPLHWCVKSLIRLRIS